MADSYISGMIHKLEDDPLLTEINFEGSLFDPREMERLWEKTHQGLWFWSDWEMVMAYNDQLFRDAVAS